MRKGSFLEFTSFLNDVWLLDLKTLLALRRRLQNMSPRRVAKKMWRRLKAEGVELLPRRRRRHLRRHELFTNDSINRRPGARV